MGNIFTKSRGITVGLALLALAVVNRIPALAPAKKAINGQ